MNPGFTYRQWPGFGPRTHPFGLAGTYVFIKQSGPPRHCDLRSQGSYPRTAGTPSPEVTGPICRVPWPGVAPRRLGLLTQGHLCRFSVRARGLLPGPLFTGPGSRADPPKTAGYSRLRPVLAMTALPGLQRLAREEPRVGLSEGVRSGACVAALLPPRCRNINLLPFRPVRVTAGLRTD